MMRASVGAYMSVRARDIVLQSLQVHFDGGLVVLLDGVNFAELL